MNREIPASLSKLCPSNVMQACKKSRSKTGCGSSQSRFVLSATSIFIVPATTNKRIDIIASATRSLWAVHHLQSWVSWAIQTKPQIRDISAQIISLWTVRIMNSESRRSGDDVVTTPLPAVWTAVPLSDGCNSDRYNRLHNEEQHDDDSKSSSRPRSAKQLLFSIFLKMHISAILVLSMMTFLAVSVNVLAEPSPTMWWVRTLLGVLLSTLQLCTLRDVIGKRSLWSFYNMPQKTLYVLASVMSILLGIWTSDESRFPRVAPIYYDLNSCFFVVLGLMSSRRAIDSLHDGVPNALFSCASSNKGWVRMILSVHPLLVLNTFFLASLPNEGQISLNKPFFWLAGWPILFLSHIWRRQVALRLHVRSDAAIVIDTTTQRLVFDQVKLAFEAPVDNDLHPEYFENVFDADSSRSVIVERCNGMEHFVVCPEEPEDFIKAVSLAVQMST